MSAHGDDEGEMSFHRLFTDRDAEAILSGGSADAEFDDLKVFLGEVRRVAAGTEVVASPVLRSMLTNGFSNDKGDLSATTASNVHGPAVQVAELPKRRTRMPIPQFVAGLSLVGKLALGAGVAAAAAGGAAATGVLPNPVQHSVATVVNAVMPFDIPDPDHHATVTVPDAPATASTTFGNRVSNDANGGDGSEKGVDGATISSDARARQHGQSCVVPTTTVSVVPDESTSSTEATGPAVDNSACKPDTTGKPDATGKPTGTPAAATQPSVTRPSTPEVSTPADTRPTTPVSVTPVSSAPPVTTPAHPGKP